MVQQQVVPSIVLRRRLPVVGQFLVTDKMG